MHHWCKLIFFSQSGLCKFYSNGKHLCIRCRSGSNCSFVTKMEKQKDLKRRKEENSSFSLEPRLHESFKNLPPQMRPSAKSQGLTMDELRITECHKVAVTGSIFNLGAFYFSRRSRSKILHQLLIGRFLGEYFFDRPCRIIRQGDLKNLPTYGVHIQTPSSIWMNKIFLIA